ncbi:hypothetical protein OS670_13300 [Pseudomonadaceae bacterium T75]|uniref:hypothetical protein n=1 Tax=Stutzerimonas nitrititolerans TaxID=2482751 RepID=UPI002271FE53|nr:hypothetical protein [Stutzerimonas nitrititolerans]WAD25394.1 hypothetical protein OS670_13300 [Pseudomonadaceae bacterium T75]
MDQKIELTLEPVTEHGGGARYELWLGLHSSGAARFRPRRFRIRSYNLGRYDPQVEARTAFRLIEAALTRDGAIRPCMEDLIEVLENNRSDTLSLFVTHPSRFAQRDAPYFQSLFATVFHDSEWTLGNYMDIALELEILLPFEGPLGIGMVESPFQAPLLMLLGETW